MKLARIGIFLTGMIGLMFGGLVTIGTLKSHQDEEAIRSNEALKTEATLLIEQFHAAIETARKQSMDSPSPSYIVHRGSLKIDQGQFSEMDAFSVADPSYEEKLFQSLKEQIPLGELKLSGVVLGQVDFPEGGGKSGIFVAVPATPVRGPMDSLPAKVNFFLIDPARALPGLGKLSLADEAAFLFHKNGKVLAHTLPAYVGTDLTRIPDLKESLTNLFLGAQTGFVQRYASMDGARQRLAVVRAGAQAFAVGVERRVPAPVLSAGWFAEQWSSGAARRNLGSILVLLSCSFLLFAGFSSWAARSLQREIEEARRGRVEKPMEPPAAKVESAREVLEPVDQAVENLVQNRAEMDREEQVMHTAVRAMIPGQEQLMAVISRIERAYALEAVEQELVTTCASWISGHAIYFRYQPKIQNLSVSSISQDLPANPILRLQVYVRKDIEQQVEQFAASGKVASLTHYGPMKKAIQGEIEGAAYEAWAVTTTPEVSGASKLVGVLVLLHSGEVDPGVRPWIGRLIRESGNFLQAMGNRISPKGTPREVPHPVAAMTAGSDPA